MAVIFQFVLAVRDDRPGTNIFDATSMIRKILYANALPDEVQIEVASINEMLMDEKDEQGDSDAHAPRPHAMGHQVS